MKYLLFLVLLCSCQMSSSTNYKKLSITYFKDVNTGLCFASVNSYSYMGYQIVSLTCVPCDSLKRYVIPIR